jgi:hypothetical protein
MLAGESFHAHCADRSADRGNPAQALWGDRAVDTADRDHFEQRVRPLLNSPGIEFIGEIGDAEKPAF